ncbi:MAG TPA: DUF2891 domain-containing protein [Propionicimonas sp.]|jgi:hypothetical protein|nr:DUF2891 domain-containing protein [Propionicimonas sp.]
MDDRLPALAPLLAATIGEVITREYPNHLGHVLSGPDDRPTPRQLHPAFYGCFDWHSAVHMHWALLRLLPLLAEPDAATARRLLERHLTPANLAAELAYLQAHPHFERPYGWAWTLQLAAEPGAPAALRPLALHLEQAALGWLANLPGPVRHGMHLNTAFALRRMLAWARLAAAEGRPGLQERIEASALGWFGGETDYPLRFEPGPHDFLSPALAEADLVARFLPAAGFATWLERFLPVLGTLGDPVEPPDRSDGQFAHLDGLNLYRGHALRALAARLPAGHPRVPELLSAAEAGISAGLGRACGGDYMGEHWLATYAVLALADPS